MKKNAIVVKNVSKKYSRKADYALKNVSFTVEAGDFHGFIGPNGAGKTTVIKSLIGAFWIQEGSMKIFDKMAGTPASKEFIGYVPEKADFNAGRFYTTYRCFYDMCLLEGIKKEKIERKIRRVCKQLSITQDLLYRSPSGFSSGQKKKVLIGQALLGDPKLLILDEPTANLDPTARSFVLSLLKKINAENGVTIFISSHVLTELQKYVSGYTLINEGRILINETRNALKESRGMDWEVVFKGEVNKRKLLNKKWKVEAINERTFYISLKNKDFRKELQNTLFLMGAEIETFKERGLDLEKLYLSNVVKR